ncbi:MAG: tetratricopeptide repeat protein [Bacteroidales bacterium]|nr:tetratricopeptide repeat protein [Bacteroidales bacterium]
MKRCLFFLFALTLLPLFSMAQTLEEAKQLFFDNKFAEAKPVFATLVKKTPRNASYNHWYGVCLYKTGETESAIKYLTFAASKKIQEAPRYLGDAFFDLYRFEEAAKQYEDYLAKQKEEQIAAIYNKKAETARNAAGMVSRVADVQIIDSIVVNKKKLFATYKERTLEQNIHLLSDYFETGEGYDDACMFINSRETSRIFPASQSGKGLDFMRQEKLSDSWGERKILPKEVNSDTDENYPFILSDGLTIYFGSKGHNSIGGYDIFVTRYDAENGSYYAAENLGMPFNSPANDYLYAIDEVHNIGWFVTDRNQESGKAIIYTFIRDENRQNVQDKTPEEKIALAQIRSIRATWKKPNYKLFLEDIYKEKRALYEAYQEKKSEEFHFYIDENTVYTRLENFKSLDARSYYQQYIEKQKQVDEMETKLSSWRALYAKETKTGKEELKSKILKLEKEYESIATLPYQLQNKCRSAELSQLKQK